MKSFYVFYVVIALITIVFILLLVFADWSSTDAWLRRPITELSITELIIIMLVVGILTRGSK